MYWKKKKEEEEEVEEEEDILSRKDYLQEKSQAKMHDKN